MSARRASPGVTLPVRMKGCAGRAHSFRSAQPPSQGAREGRLWQLADQRGERTAFDRGSDRSLALLGEFHSRHRDEIFGLASHYTTLCFAGEFTSRPLPLAKVIDMYGFQRGYRTCPRSSPPLPISELRTHACLWLHYYPSISVSGLASASGRVLCQMRPQARFKLDPIFGVESVVEEAHQKSMRGQSASW